MDSAMFENEVEQNQHEDAIETLCEQYPNQCSRIRLSYEQQLTAILPEATIRSYLPIFISRSIRRSIETDN